MIVTYKGYIFINATIGGKNTPDEEWALDNFSEGLINNPLNPGQLGFLYRADKVTITKEALVLLKTVKPSGDDIGDVDVYEAGGNNIFGWLGGPYKAFKPLNVTGSNSFDPNLLDNLTVVDSIVSEEIKKSIDNYNNKT